MPKRGLCATKEYRAWESMKRRCENPKDSRFDRYGGRGIAICDRWRNSSTAFLADMGPCPPGYTLDRIDNDGNYEPSNCRWADRVTQRRNNTGPTVLLTHRGRTMRVTDWARELGVGTSTLLQRHYDGWSDDEVIGIPVVPLSEGRSYRPKACTCRVCGRGFTASNPAAAICSSRCESKHLRARRTALLEAQTS